MSTGARAMPAVVVPLIRAGYALIGVMIIGAGAATLQVGKVGVDPYTALNIGISEKLGWTLGSYQLLSNIVLFIPVLAVGRKYIGAGTVINMVLTGFFIDVFTRLFEAVSPDRSPTLLTMSGFFLVGIVVFCFGASAYMSAGVGTAPYDAIAPMIVDRTGMRYQRARVPQDVLTVVAAVVAGGPVGFGTIMTAFFCGPLIAFFSEHVNRPVVTRLTHGAGAKIAHPDAGSPGDPTKLL